MPGVSSEPEVVFDDLGLPSFLDRSLTAGPARDRRGARRVRSLEHGNVARAVAQRNALPDGPRIVFPEYGKGLPAGRVSGSIASAQIDAAAASAAAPRIGK